MDYKVSIIIPTYNGGNTIRQTLESVLQQEYTNYEVVVIDDGSTDSTVEIVKRFLPSARIIQQDNQGTLAARQTGINVAHGDLIALLDQDDLWFKENLRVGVRVFEKNPEVGLVVANMQAINERDDLLGFDVIPNPESYTLLWENLLLIQPIATSTTLFRKELVPKIGGLDTRFGFSGALGDLDMFIRMSEVTQTYFINKCLGLYRWSETRPGRLISFLDNLQIYAEKYWQHPRLLEKDNLDLRIKFAQACCNYAIHIYRLLLEQYNYKIPAKLLLKLNKHNEAMDVLFKDIYRTNIQLRPLNLELFDINKEVHGTLLFLYLLRKDLQKSFPKVAQGDLDELLEWASEVIKGNFADKDSNILSVFSIELDNQKRVSFKKRLKFLRISGAQNAQKMRFFLSNTLHIIFPKGSRRRRFLSLLKLGIKTIFSDGWESFIRKSYLFVSVRSNSILASWIEKIVAVKQELLLSLAIKKLIFPLFDSAQVAIVVKASGNKNSTYRCLYNLLAYSRTPYKVYVLSNEANLSSNYFSKFEHIVRVGCSKELDNDVELYGLLRNQLENENYILFLSDSIIVTENYLQQMVAITEMDAKCGVVTSRVVDKVKEALFHAGGILGPNGKSSFYGFGDVPDKPEYSYVRSVDIAFPDFYLIRVEILADFYAKEQFVQDTSMYFQLIRKAGYEIKYQPESTVLLRIPETIDRSRYQIQSRPIVNQSVEELALRSVRSKAKILVIDDFIPAIRYGSGFPRLYEMLVCLAELGYSVTFFPIGNPIKVQPETEKLQQKGVEIFWEHFANLQQFIQARSDYYDVILISRPHVFKTIFPKIKRYFPESAILYDAEAIFYTRELLRTKVLGTETNNGKVLKIAREEMRLIEMADLVISVSQKDKEIMQEKSSQENIEVWGHIQDVNWSEIPFEQRNGILFFGSFFAGSGSPNEDAILYFAKDIFPSIQKKLECKLYIVGASPTPTIEALSSANIVVTGYVENLGEYFNLCKVNVVPTRFAAGIPLKLLEAMSYGIPAVVTALISEQLNLVDGLDALVAQNSSEFIEKIIHLYSDKELWNQISTKSLEYIQEKFSKTQMYSKLDEIIERTLEFRNRKLLPYVNK